jgi:hypothetical protein
VLSAVEGLEIAAPGLKPFVVPLTVAILIGLFTVQRLGTARVGALFGPVTFVWFVSLAALGVGPILDRPEVLAALNPVHFVRFLSQGGSVGYLVLGSVFLVVTGGEALYADMGHFGPRPIRRTWFAIVMPALLINYFGQGALLLADPGAASSPFYRMAPGWALYPLIALSTLATVIASQAMITVSRPGAGNLAAGHRDRPPAPAVAPDRARAARQRAPHERGALRVPRRHPARQVGVRRPHSLRGPVHGLSDDRTGTSDQRVRVSCSGAGCELR